MKSFNFNNHSFNKHFLLIIIMIKIKGVISNVYTLYVRTSLSFHIQFHKILMIRLNFLVSFNLESIRCFNLI